VRAQSQIHVLEGERGFEAFVLEEAARIGVMFLECLELEQEGQVPEREIFENVVKIATNKFFQRHFVMLASLRNVIQETCKCRLLDLFELGLHIADIRGELQLQAIVKVDLVGGVNALELQVIAQSFAERREGLLPDLGHEEQRRTDIEAVPIPENLVAASPRREFLFQYGYIISIFSQ